MRDAYPKAVEYTTLKDSSWSHILSLYDFLGKKVKKKQGYARTGHKIDAARLAELKPDIFEEFSTNLINSGKKNVLLADWELYVPEQENTFELYRFYSQFLRYLKSQHFEVYIFFGKKLVAVDSIHTVFRCHKTRFPFADTAAFNAALSQQGRNPDQFLIVDHCLALEIQTVASHLEQINLASPHSTEILAQEQKKALANAKYTLVVPLEISEETLRILVRASQPSKVKAIKIYSKKTQLDDLGQRLRALVSHLTTIFGVGQKPPKVILDFPNIRDHVWGETKIGTDSFDHYPEMMEFESFRASVPISKQCNKIKYLQYKTSYKNPSDELLALLNEFKSLEHLNFSSLYETKLNLPITLSLRKLYLNPGVKEIQNLANNTQLEEFSGDLTPEIYAGLSLLPGLQKLLISNGHIAEIDLSLFPKLRQFSLPFSKSYSLTGLKNLHYLADVSINFQNCKNTIDVLNELNQYLSLQQLTLSDFEVKKTVSLKDCRNLKIVKLDNAYCSQLLLPAELEELSLRNTALPETKHSQLRTLDIYGLDLDHFSFLDAADSLETLIITWCKNFSAINNFLFPKLKTLHIVETEIDRLNLALFPQLRSLILNNMFHNQLINFGDQIGEPTLRSAALRRDQLKAASSHPRFEKLESFRVLEKDYSMSDDPLIEKFTHLKISTVAAPPDLSWFIHPNSIPEVEFMFHFNQDNSVFKGKECLHDRLGPKRSGLVFIDNNNESYLEVKELKPAIPTPESKNKTLPAPKPLPDIISPSPLLKKTTFDGTTYTDPQTTIQEVQYIYRKYGGKVIGIPSSQYRLSVLTQVELSATEGLDFLTDSPEQDRIAAFPGTVADQKDEITPKDFECSGDSYYYARIPLTYLIGLFPPEPKRGFSWRQDSREWIPLPGAEADAQITAIHLPPGTKRAYNFSKHQYEIKLPEKIPDNFYITYLAQRKGADVQKSLTKPPKKMVDARISYILNFLLESKLAEDLFPPNFIKFRNAFKKPSPDDRWDILVDYFTEEEKENKKRQFTGFVNEALSTQPHYKTALAELLKLKEDAWPWVQSLIEAKGSCRHAANLFYLLATTKLKQELRLIRRDRHRDIEFQRGGAWLRLDLGGAEVKELSPVNTLPNAAGSSHQQPLDPLTDVNPERWEWADTSHNTTVEKPPAHPRPSTARNTVSPSVHGYDFDYLSPATQPDKKEDEPIREQVNREQAQSIETKSAPEVSSQQKQPSVKTELLNMESLFLSPLQSAADACNSLEGFVRIFDKPRHLLIHTAHSQQNQAVFLALQEFDTLPERSVGYTVSAKNIKNSFVAYHFENGSNTLHNRLPSLARLIRAPDTTESKMKSPKQPKRLVNNDHFIRKERNRFKTLRDVPATLDNLPVDPELQLIWLASRDTELSEAFSSRFPNQIIVPEKIRDLLDAQPLQFDLRFGALSAERETKESKSKDTWPNVNLYRGGVNWEEALFGQTLLKDNKLHFEPGILVKALLQGEPGLIIKNPPTAEQDNEEYIEFQGFWAKLQGLGRFEVGAEQYNLRQGSRIDANGVEHRLPSPHFRIQRVDEPLIQATGSVVNLAHEPRFYILNDNNYRSFFQQVSTDAKGTNSRPGWFQDCEDGRLMIVDQSLSAGKQECAQAFCQAKNKKIRWANSRDLTASLSDEKIPAAGAYLIQSTDPEFTVQTLQAKYYAEHKKELTVIPAHEHLRYRDLMDTIINETPLIWPESAESYDINLMLRYEEKPLLKASLKGEMVLVSGSLSLDCSQELASLFSSPPHVHTNAERVEIKGPLLWVTPPLPYDTALIKVLNKERVVSPDWKDYESKLLAEEKFNANIIQRVGKLYALAQRISHGTAGTPPRLLWNYRRIKQAILAILEAEKTKEPGNPVEAWLLFDYDPSWEAHAYLSVCSRILFDFNDEKPGVYTETRLKQTGEAATWQALNSYNASALRQALGIEHSSLVTNPEYIDDLFAPSLPVDALPRCADKVVNALRTAENLKDLSPLSSMIDIHLSVLKWMKRSRLIFLKGSPGTGKTHTVDALSQFPNIKIYGGKNTIREWAKAHINPAAENAYLILPFEEANLNCPQDSWNFLGTIRENPPYIIYEGERLELTPNHIVMFLANPEGYSPDRDFHILLQEAPIVFFRNWEDREIQAWLLTQWPKHATTPLDMLISDHGKESTLRLLIQGFRILEKTFPTLFPPGRLSLRDFQQLFDRFYLRYQQWITSEKLEHTPVSALSATRWLSYSVCRDHGIGLLPSPEQRKEYHLRLQPLFFPEPEEIKITFSVSAPEIKLLKQRMILPEKGWHDVATLCEDFRLNESTKKPCRSILLEGPSGSGKSTLFLNLFDVLGYKKITPDVLKALYAEYEKHKDSKKITIEKCFIHLTGGNSENLELATAAFMLGIPVLWDEINEEPLQEFLNGFLTGRTRENQKPYLPGFFVAGTLNSGLAELPLDYVNRFRKLYMLGYDHDQLIEMASPVLSYRGATEAQIKQFVEDFEQLCQRSLGKINFRNFFQVLQAFQGLESNYRPDREFSFAECVKVVKEQQASGKTTNLHQNQEYTVKNLMHFENLAVSKHTASEQKVSESKAPAESKQEPVAEVTPVSLLINFPDVMKTVETEAKFNTTAGSLVTAYTQSIKPNSPGLFQSGLPLSISTAESMGLICLLAGTLESAAAEQKRQVLQLACAIVAKTHSKTPPATSSTPEPYYEYLAVTTEKSWESEAAIQAIARLGWKTVLEQANNRAQPSLLTRINLTKTGAFKPDEYPGFLSSKFGKIRAAVEQLNLIKAEGTAQSAEDLSSRIRR